MRIASLTLHRARIPLKRAIEHASHRRTWTDNILIHCRLTDGTEGWGESVPRDYVTGETAERVRAVLSRSQLAQQLHPCAQPRDVLEMLENLRLEPGEPDPRGCQTLAARCALELAILDAYFRHFQQPVSAIVSILAPELHVPRNRVQYSGVITSSRGFKLRALGWFFRLSGFRQVKLKVGIPGQDDANRIRSLRSRLGSRVAIRVDANEAWPIDQALDKILELDPGGIESVEQPVSHEDIAGLSEIRQHTRVPIMLDESLCSRMDAERAVRDNLCDLFNLRISKCGGLIGTIRLAQFAAQAGRGYQIGCQVGETAILSAAGRHLACQLGGWKALEGSFDRYLVGEPLAREDMTFGRGGWAPALAGPGLGITVPPEHVRRVSQVQEQLLG